MIPNLTKILKFSKMYPDNVSGTSQWHSTMVADENAWVEDESTWSYSNSSLKVIQGGDKRATKTVQVVRLEASAEANAVALIKWSWNYRVKCAHIL